MGSLLARAYKRILSGKLAQDAGEHWVTVNAGSKEGGEGGGSHVLLDGEGRVIAGMGGKFKGQNIDRIERKKFINQNAWSRQRDTLIKKSNSAKRKRLHAEHVNPLMAPENYAPWEPKAGRSALNHVLEKGNVNTEGMGLINKLHAGLETESLLRQKEKEQQEAHDKHVIEKLKELYAYEKEQEKQKQAREEPKAEEPKVETVQKEVAYRKNERLKEQQRQDELQKLIRSAHKDFADQNLHTPEAQAFYFGTFNRLDGDLSQKSTEERNKILADARAEYEKVKGDISEKTRASIDEHLEHLDRATAIIDRLRKNTQKQQEAPKAETPKADRKSLIDQVNARHTMPMGDIIARKEQSITDKINNSNLSEEDKKKYLDKLNSLTDEALKAGAGSLDLYKVGVSYKKTNAESNAFNKMFSKQSEIDNLEKEINKKVQDNVTQAENKNTLNSLNEAESTGAVYFKDANGKEFYRANSKSKTWYQIDQYNQAKGEKAKAKQEALNAKKQQATPKAEEQPRGMKNAFSDKYQKIDNSNLNEYQKVDNISNNKNTENGVTNMNTNQESQATPKADATASMGIKDYEGKANINPRVATYIEDMGLKLSKDQYDKIATDYPPGNRSGGALALAGRDMRALQAFTKEYAKEISNTIADQEAAFEDMGGYHDFKGGSITISKKGDYLGNTQHASISFAGKPSEETRSLLKKNGFTYNPRYKTWENTARLGANKHEKILQTLKDGVTIESTQQATPTAQPTQQAEGKQYHGTGIENKNGRYEVSFNEFPSYKLRTDMKANGFKWDPNAKVWHTTDREKLDKVMSKHFTERT